MVELTASLAPPLRVVLGVPAGVLATLAMDVAMARLPEGDTPPRVASGVLTDRHPDEAPGRLATAAHYLAGLLTGPLCVVLVLLVEGLLGVSARSYLVAAVVLYLLMTGFFVLVVLPRPDVLPDRVSGIRRAWAVEAAVYVVVVVVLAWVGAQVVAAV